MDTDPRRLHRICWAPVESHGLNVVMELMELGEAMAKKPHLTAEWVEFLSSLLFPAQVLSSILAVRKEAGGSPYAGGGQMSSLSHLSCLPAVACVPTAAFGPVTPG